MKINIPNPGFYCSLFSETIENELEREKEYLIENEGLEEHDAEEQAELNMPYAETEKRIARAYVNLFASWLMDDLELKNLQLDFVRIISPKYYNFTSDKIQAEISEENASALYNALIKRVDVQAAIKAAGTPRDGYMPFYSPYCTSDDWKLENLCPARWEILLSPIYEASMEDESRFYDVAEKASEACY